MNTFFKTFEFKDIDPNYFKQYGGDTYSKNYQNYTLPASNIIEDLIYHDISFDTILDIGCASGELVRDFRDLGVKAYGIEKNQYIMKKNIMQKYCITLDLKYIGILGKDVFDVGYANSLMYLFPQEIPNVLKDFYKVFKSAIYLWTPFTNDPPFPDPYRKFVASENWWRNHFEEAGFKKLTRYLYSK